MRTGCEKEHQKKKRIQETDTLSFVVTVIVWCCPVAAWRRPSPVATEV